MSELQIPLWLSIGLAIFVGLVAVWQVPRIRVRLSGDYATERAEPEGVSGFKHWGKLLAGLMLFLVLGAFGEAWLWTQQTYEMAGTVLFAEETRIEQGNPQKKLPVNYVFKKNLWQLGFVPRPTFIDLPKGKFDMGSEALNSNASPRHTVTISNVFSMSQQEITFEQYDYFIWHMRKTGMQQEINGKSTDYLYPFDQDWGRGNRPVINVSWWDAQAYSNWLSKEINRQCRLPSEAEWEYTARNDTTTEYPWGNEVGENNANCHGCGSQWDKKQTAPVGSFKSKTFDLHDMHGNVREWVQDTWHESYKESPINGEAWEVDGDFSHRVLRGGSWKLPTLFMQSTSRLFEAPETRSNDIGFRIVCSPH